MSKKLEAIKNAYLPNNWEIIGKYVNENGWLNVFSLLDLPPVYIKDPEYKNFPVLINDVSEDYVEEFVRPDCLKGIEDNNGWTKINNIKDIPKFTSSDMTLYLVCFNGKPVADPYQACEIYTAFTTPGDKPSHYKLYNSQPKPIY